jgi:hypothetical protein
MAGRTVRVAAIAIAGLGVALLGASQAAAQEPEPISIVEVEVPSADEMDRLLGAASDVTEHIEYRGDERFVQIVTTESELALLRAQGFEIGRTVDTEARMRSVQRQHLRSVRRGTSTTGDDGIVQNVAEGEHIKILRADYFTNLADQQFISVEAKTDAGEDDTLTVRWDSGEGTPMGSGGTTTLSDFVDAGVYLYHRRQIPVAARPFLVEVTSEATGETLIGAVRDWAPPTDETGNPEVVDFIDGYLDPTQAYDRIKTLAEQHPNIAEIVELPYLTNGYRRRSLAQFGTEAGGAGSIVVFESKAYGSEGGDNVTVTLRDPGVASSPLSVESNRSSIVVNLATDETGAVVSTAAEVVGAVDAKPGAPADAFTYQGNEGLGVVAPAPETKLEDNLVAPPHVSRKPHPMYAIRIGRDRSGDKIGVYAYAQEHAREWVGPLVAVETAERLVRNYEVNPNIRRLLRNVEVFILPSANPDGGHYSFYDFNGQRKNLVDYCGDDRGEPGRRNQWGVDLNRNYSVGTVFDGYVGGSLSCTSGNFSGPFEFSEAETKNVEWIADNFPNIRFSMNIHSSGNFFMWPPGAYTPERVTLPRATLGEESYFWGAAGRIVGAIRNWRNLTVTPRQTGPVADVLYSAAGNSGDEFWYENHIYGWDFEIGTSFQPQWEEAHNVAMEFANGVVELVKIAEEFAGDGRPPTSTLWKAPTADGKVKIKFLADEPATVYYRLDGRRPTYGNSTMYLQAGAREGGETITLEETTTVTWFAVDAAGNVERNYRPDPGSVSNRYRSETVLVPAGDELVGGETGGGEDVQTAAPAPAAPAPTSSAPASAPAPVQGSTTTKSSAKRKAAKRKAAKRKAAKRKAARLKARQRAAQRRARR